MITEDIIAEYEQGNADTRMSLYLYFRELRETFDRIDTIEPEEHIVPCCAS